MSNSLSHRFSFSSLLALSLSFSFTVMFSFLCQSARLCLSFNIFKHLLYLHFWFSTSAHTRSLPRWLYWAVALFASSKQEPCLAIDTIPEFDKSIKLKLHCADLVWHLLNFWEIVFLWLVTRLKAFAHQFHFCVYVLICHPITKKKSPLRLLFYLFWKFTLRDKMDSGL